MLDAVRAARQPVGLRAPSRASQRVKGSRFEVILAEDRPQVHPLLDVTPVGFHLDGGELVDYLVADGLGMGMLVAVAGGDDRKGLAPFRHVQLELLRHRLGQGQQFRILAGTARLALDGPALHGARYMAAPFKKEGIYSTISPH